jgi:biopolymer transport protein ExbD
MKLSRSVQINPALFLIVPLVAVLFVVILFFTLSSRFVLQPGISVTLPFSTFTLGPQRDPQIVSITSGPVPAIYFRDQKLTLDDFGKSLSSSPGKDKTLIIKADRGTPYEAVVSVMNQGLQAGFSIVLATSEERR